MRRTSSVVAAALLALPAAAVDVEVVEQERGVNAGVTVPPCFGDDNDGSFAPDFDPFGASIVAEYGCEAAYAVATATQDSQINATTFIASGSAASQAHGPVMAVLHSVASSGYRVRFEVTEPCSFVMTAALGAESGDGQQFPLAGSVVQLTEVGVVDVFEHFVQAPAGGGQTLEQLHSIGLLAPGVYDLRATASSIIDNQVPPSLTGNATYEMSFELRRPGDVDGDGGVEVKDLLFLVAAWGPCDPEILCEGDVDGDGLVGVGDLVIVLANWG